jgi:hypothetical protein
MISRNTDLRKYIALPLLALAAMLTGCATGPAFEKLADVAPDKALIYVYRPPVMHGAIFSPGININDQLKFSLSNGGYRPYVTLPGTVTVSISNAVTRSISFETVAGQTYYVRGGTVPMGMGVPSIEAVSAVEGAEEIKECKLLPEVVAQK